MAELRNTLAVGDRITSHVQFALLPVGTVMGPENRADERYVKTADGMWQSVRVADRRYGSENFDTGGYNSVVSYPEGYNPETAEAESINDFRWRFRNHMLAAQVRHGVSAAAVNTGLRTLGCDDAAMPLGADLTVWNQRDMNRMVEGTLVYIGSLDEPVTIWKRVRTGTGWERVEGTGNVQPSDLRSPSTIIGVPIRAEDGGGMDYDPPEWMSVTDETLTVPVFKARAWLVGMKTKAQESWCGTAESVLYGIGINEESVNAVGQSNGHTVGTEVGPSAARGLPLGTVLSYANDTTKFLYQRVENAPVRAGTRRVMAFRIDGSSEPVASTSNYSGTMRIESIPVVGLEGFGDISQTAFNADLWRESAFEALPIGSVVLFNGSSYYIKARDGRMDGWRLNSRNEVPERGQYRMSDFGLVQQRAGRPDQMRVVRFGE